MLASEACSRRRQCRSLLCRAALTDLPAPDGWLRRALGNDGPTIREPSLRHTGQISGTGLDDSRYFAPRSLALRTVGASTCTSRKCSMPFWLLNCAMLRRPAARSGESPQVRFDPRCRGGGGLV